jgi:hypothetical protein
MAATIAANMPAAPAHSDLDQGWGATKHEAFYYTSQGTVIMPVSWLASLDGADGKPFMSRDRMHALGFIYDEKPSRANANDWPIGFAVDSGGNTGSVPTVGFTCAACHTSEITYHGTTMRIDGGQANINLDGFKNALNDAILATGRDPERRKDFERRAIDRGFPKAAVASLFDAKYLAARKAGADPVLTARKVTTAGPGRNDALAAIALQLFRHAIDVPGNTNEATAPVDFPYLWNIPNLYWVQYNASVRQPMGRNIGEALGVGALTQIINPKTGQLASPETRWKSSIPPRNLFALEQTLQSLRPPRWPTSVFGPVDTAKAAEGQRLFGENCAMCHGVRALASDSNEWSVKIVPLSKIGTDPRQADNFAKFTYDGTKLGLSKSVTAGPALLMVTNGLRTQAYRDAAIPESEWPKYDGGGRKNVLTAPCGYKARPLVGVWATPPFLHNGSVPTIFDMLSDSRPATFQKGSVEYDPVHLGFENASGAGAFTFDTSIVGNSNAGHWFTNDRARPGRIGRGLSDAEKYSIIEYLKIASYANYPRTVVQHPDPEPCVDAEGY